MKTRKVKEGLIIVSVLVALVLVYPLTNFIKPTKEEQKVDGPNFESPIINNAGYSVSSTSDYANEIAINVLNNGGNAVDAVIAMSFALGVTSPQNGVLGSGGLFLVYSSQEDQAFVYDFYGSSGYEKSNYNIGIPGYLKGIDLIHSDYGTKPIEELIQPSIDLARNGIIVNRDLGEIFERRPWIAEMNSSFYKDGVIVKEGEILIQEELANTYEFVKNEGLLSFYETDNPITQNFMDISGYSLESLKDYKAIKHDALVLEYDNKKMFVPNAPFSGLTSAQILIMLGENDINFSNLDDDSYNTIKKIYLNAFDYNRKTVADDDSIREHIKVDFKNHTYGLDLNNAINDNVFDVDESENTTSYTVIDKDGLTVVGVHTLSNYWGSTYARDGFFYNNVLKNFSKKGINAFDYHKRPKTYISPVILSSDSEIIAIGTPGAYAIPQVTANLIHQISRNDISLSQAMDMRQMALYDDYLVFDTQGVRKNDFNELPYTLEYSTYPNNVTLSRFSISRKVGDKFESYYDKYWCESNCALDFNE